MIIISNWLLLTHNIQLRFRIGIIACFCNWIIKGQLYYCIAVSLERKWLGYKFLVFIFIPNLRIRVIIDRKK